MTEHSSVQAHGDAAGRAGSSPGHFKRNVILLILAYSFVCGVIVCFLPMEASELDFFVGVPFLLLGVAWCWADAESRGEELGLLMKALLVLVFVVGFPMYLAKSRGLKPFVAAVGWTLLLLVGMVGSMAVAMFLTIFLGDMTGAWEVTI